MQFQIRNFNGEIKSTEAYSTTDPQAMIDFAVSISAEGGGYIVIIGTNLDKRPTEMVANIVASNGLLIFQNVLNPNDSGSTFRRAKSK